MTDSLQAEIRIIKSCLSSLDPGLYWPVPTNYKELAEKMEMSIDQLKKIISINPAFATVVNRILADNELLSCEKVHA